MLIKIILSLSLLLFTFCQSGIDEKTSKKDSIINSSHLDSLYEEINVDDKTIGIIHIYSEYPDYKWVGDTDEGIACIDDAARAAVFYLRNYQSNKDRESLRKSERLMEFLFYMHSENGFFYNFILEDHSINKTHRNSINVPDWWSWRAMWALSEGYKIFKDVNINLARKILSVLASSVEATKKSILLERSTTKINGIEFPTWLPSETASDQASVLVLAFLNYFDETMDTSVIIYINDLCDGILLMQKGDVLKVPFYAFLSWQNVWHAYGNSQSYALLKASKVLQRDDLQTAALNEINFFYDYLIGENYISSFEIENENNVFEFIKKNKFSQIAYNFRPMVFACIEAFNLTNDSVYVFKAIEIASWFFGNNIAEAQMYFNSSGICYDGINSQNTINKNSGAESTLEALLTLLAIEKNSISKKVLNKYLIQDTN
jgi:hypothetical protein